MGSPFENSKKVGPKMTDASTPATAWDRLPTDEDFVSNILREPIDVSTLLLRNNRQVNTPSFIEREEQEDSSIAEDDLEPTQVTVAGLDESQVSKVPKSHRCFKYAGMPFKAMSDMYLNSTFEGSFRQTFPQDMELTGRIIVCPNKKNGNMFTIDWNIGDKADINVNWLIMKLSNTASMRKKLESLISEFKEDDIVPREMK
jgi:hypothetical protein